MLACGCSRIGSAPKPKPGDDDVPKITVVSKGVTMDSFSPDGKRVWSITAERVLGEVGPGADSAELRNVGATLYGDGKEGLRLRADEGTADEGTGKLILRGNVVASTDDGFTRITCDRILWERDDRVLVATGNVFGSTGGMTLGPATSARATFKTKEDKMNSTAAAALILTSLVVQGNPVSYRDKGGNMSVQAKTFSTTYDEAKNLYNFVGTGPFVARWLKQKITITGTKMTGVVAPVGPKGNQSLELREGEFTGGIEARLEDPGKRGRMTLTGLSRFGIVSIEDGKRWKISGNGAPFKADFPDSGVVVTGNSFQGTADRALTNGTEAPEWRTATFSGGVHATLKQNDKKTGKPFSLDAQCPTVTLDRSSNTLVMTGGVVVNGDHPALGPVGAELKAPKITLEFDKEMRILKKVTMEGT